MPRSHRSRRLRRPLLVSALLALTLSPAGLTARNAWDGPAFSSDPEALMRAASAVPGNQGEGVAVLFLESAYRYDEAGRETLTQRIVYRILSAAAHESWSVVEERWSPWHQARPEIRVRVLTPDGAEHRLAPAAIANRAAGRDSLDRRVLRVPLPGIRPGAVVEQEVTIRDNAPFFDRGVVRAQELDDRVTVRHARVVVDAPVGMPLHWVVRGLEGVQTTESVSRERRRVVFEAHDLPARLHPASVAFSTGRSWADVARRYSDIVDQAIRGSDLRSFLRSAGGPAASQLDLMRLYLARVSREIRYTGTELDEGRLVPRKPAETLRRRLGDCKDKAVLLTAMLRAAGIPAYVALLSAGEGEPDVEGSLPGLGAFNHAIVVVPGHPAVWIDPTDPDSRAGELPAGDQGRLALIASPSTVGLVRTPTAAGEAGTARAR
jgi:transglutaminase-like putative cysteine protease